MSERTGDLHDAELRDVVELTITMCMLIFSIRELRFFIIYIFEDHSRVDHLLHADLLRAARNSHLSMNSEYLCMNIT